MRPKDTAKLRVWYGNSFALVRDLPICKRDRPITGAINARVGLGLKISTAILVTSAVLRVAWQSYAQTGRIHITFVKSGPLRRAHGSGNLFFEAGAAGNIIGTYHAAGDGLAVIAGDNVVQLRNSNGAP